MCIRLSNIYISSDVVLEMEPNQGVKDENLCPPGEGVQHAPFRTEATLVAANHRIPVLNMVKLLIGSVNNEVPESAGLIVQRVYRLPLEVETQSDVNGNVTT